MTITQRHVRGSAREPIDPGADELLGSRPSDVRLRTRRNPRLIAVGVLLACLGGLTGATLLTTSSHTSSVVVMAHSVVRGETVRANDLGAVTIGRAPGVRTVPSSQLSRLVGHAALVDLPEGSLPGPDAVGDPIVPPDYSQVGLRLETGRVPVSELPPGTAVELVPVSATASDPTPQRAPIAAVVVTSPQTNDTGAAVLLDVAVPADAGVVVAQLAARGELAVVRVGRG